MDAVPTKDVVELLQIAVEHEGLAEAVALFEHFRGRIHSEAVPTKVIIGMLWCRVKNEDSAGAVALLALLGERIGRDTFDAVPTKMIIDMLRSSVEHEYYAVAVALLEHFGERIGRDIGTKVTEAQAEATSNADTGLSMSILKPYAKLMTHLHSNDIIHHWA